MITWPYLLLVIAVVLLIGFRAGTRYARASVLPPRLADPPEPEPDARDDWWRE